MKLEHFFLSPVEVVKVTSQNLEEVAAWCGGTVQETESRRVKGRMDKYVWVPTPKDNKISWAFPGMFVTKRLVLTLKDEFKTTYSVFRRDYFEKNYFETPQIAFERTWERQAKEKAPKRRPEVEVRVQVKEAFTEAVEKLGLKENIAEELNKELDKVLDTDDYKPAPSPKTVFSKAVIRKVEDVELPAEEEIGNLTDKNGEKVHITEDPSDEGLENAITG